MSDLFNLTPKYLGRSFAEYHHHRLHPLPLWSSTLLIFLLALPPSAVVVAAAAVGQSEESGIANGLPVTRLPRLVPHLPPRPQLHLLQPPQSLST